MRLFSRWIAVSALTLLSAFCAFGQEPTPIGTLPPATGAKPVEAPPKFILEYVTHEKCYECRMRYAVICTGTDKDCGVPAMPVTRYAPFESAEEAIKFANAGCHRNQTVYFSTEYFSFMSMARDLGEDLPTCELTRLLKVEEVPTESKTVEKEEPQPPKVTSTTTWSLKKSAKD